MSGALEGAIKHNIYFKIDTCQLKAPFSMYWSTRRTPNLFVYAKALRLYFTKVVIVNNTSK
jgi:hypothetical protein